jgi:ABC-type enterochelin transport system ATPase subunit
MKRLSDFKPLKVVELPDIGPIPGLGLTLIVGPNSAGKTRLLNDLNSRLSGDPRNPVVARRIELNKPEYQPLMDCLKDEG